MIEHTILLFSVVVSCPLVTPEEGEYQGKPTSYWAKQLGQNDIKTQLEAIKALETIGSEGVPELMKALFGAGDRQVQFLCLQSLLSMGPKAKAAIPACIAAVKDPTNEQRRLWAARILSGVGPEADAVVIDVVVPMLISLIKERKPSRMAYIVTLKMIGPRAKAAVPVLIELLQDGDFTIRQSSLQALLAMHQEGIRSLIPILKDVKHVAWKEVVSMLAGVKQGGEELVPALVEALSNTDLAIRDEARLGLRLLSIGARAAVPALIKALGDESIRDASDSAFTLGTIAGDSDRPAILEALKDKNARVREGAANALGTMGRRPKAPGPPPPVQALKADVPALIRALTDKEVAVRESAAWSLGLIGPEAKDAVPALIKALQDRSPKSTEASNGSVRSNAAWALGLIEPGAEAAAAVPVLLDMINGKGADSVARARAFSTIGTILRARYDNKGTLLPERAIDQGAEAAVPVLLEIIRKKGTAAMDIDLACGSLGAIGPRAQVAIPALIGLMKDKNLHLPNDWSQLVIALGMIGVRDKATIEELRKLTNDPDEGIKRAAIQSLESIQRMEKAKK